MIGVDRRGDRCESAERLLDSGSPDYFRRLPLAFPMPDYDEAGNVIEAHSR
jgi:hypothetical protein